MSQVKYKISELAKKLGVAALHFYNWQKEYDELYKKVFLIIAI